MSKKIKLKDSKHEKQLKSILDTFSGEELLADIIDRLEYSAFEYEDAIDYEHDFIRTNYNLTAAEKASSLKIIAAFKKRKKELENAIKIMTSIAPLIKATDEDPR